MATYLQQSDMNLSTPERWISTAIGLALATRAIRGPGLIGRVLLGSAGLTMLARGATGYCAMKGALAGETTLRSGFREQMHRLASAVGTGKTGSIDSMERLYLAELQELCSAERQFAMLIERLSRTVQHQPLAMRLNQYASELHSRKAEIEGLLARSGADTAAHPDDAMAALLRETEKMSRVCSPMMRDAAIASSLQRILHYKIAGYGTIAAYAKALGRTEQAAHFAQFADRDKSIDDELSQLAKETLNPDAIAAPQKSSGQQAEGEMRTH